MTAGISGRFEYKVELLHEDPSKTTKIEAIGDFDVHLEGQLQNLILTSQVQADGFLSKEDTIRLKLSVRPADIVRLCRQQRQALYVMKSNFSQLNKGHVDLNEKVNEMQKINNDLKLKNDALQKNFDNLNDDYEVLKRLNHDLKESNEEFIKIITDLEQKHLNDGLVQQNEYLRGPLEQDLPEGVDEGYRLIEIERGSGKSEPYIDRSTGSTWHLNAQVKNGFLSVSLEMVDGVDGRFEFLLKLELSEIPKTLISIQNSENFVLNRAGRSYWLPKTTRTSDKIWYNLSFSSPNTTRLFERENERPNNSSALVPWSALVEFVADNSQANQIDCEMLIIPRTSNNYRWALMVYPNGYGNSKNIYLGVFLQMFHGVPLDYTYRIELINEDRDKSICRESRWFLNIGQQVGWENFASLETLEAGGFLDEGRLRFNVTLTPMANPLISIKGYYWNYDDE